MIKVLQPCFIPVFFKLFSSRPILHIQIFSRPLKKGLHLKSIFDSAIFPPTSRCSLKKKKNGLHLESISDSAIFTQKSRCSLNQRFPNCAPRRPGAKVCESCCTYCFSHNNCSVKVVSSNIPFRERFRLRTFFFFRKQPDFGRKIGKSEMKSK